METSGEVLPNGVWCADGGAIYATAACALALAGMYREERATRPVLEFERTKRRVVYVPGTSEGTPTGVFVQRGDKLRFVGRGFVVHGVLGKRVGARGDAEAARAYPRIVKSAPFACLLARVEADGRPFAPQLEEEIEIRETGHLFLLVNDKERTGNQDGWTITIQR